MPTYLWCVSSSSWLDMFLLTCKKGLQCKMPIKGPKYWFYWCMNCRVGKVWNWSNLVWIKVLDFFTKFDRKFVWTKYFFYSYGSLTLEHALLTGPGSREHSSASLLGLKNHRYEKNILFRQSFYQILWKKQQLLLIPSCFIFIPYPP